MEEKTKLRQVALRALSIREHSQLELNQKLQRYSNDAELIKATIQRLQQQGLQSDARFCEAFIRYRSHHGYGPVRIAAELRHRGLDDQVISDHMTHCGEDWLQLAAAAREKRFGPKIPQDYHEKAKQMRFLQYRGFDSDTIKEVMRFYRGQNNKIPFAF